MKVTMKKLKTEYEQYYWDAYKSNCDTANVFFNFCSKAAAKYSNIEVKPSQAVAISGNIYLLNGKSLALYL